MYSQIAETATFISSRLKSIPGIVVAGDTDIFSEEMLLQQEFRFSEFPSLNGIAAATRVKIGIIGNLQVAVVNTDRQSMEDRVFPLRVLKVMGVKQLFLCAPAFSLKEELQPGMLVLHDDHLNLMGSPLVGKNMDELGPRFPDMCAPYSKALNTKILAALPGELHSGILLAVKDPDHILKDSEVAELSAADCTGDGLVAEVIAAVHMQLPVTAVSVISERKTGSPAYPSGTLEKLVTVLHSVI